MTILAAVTLDFIQYLKERTKGWAYEPLVVTNDEILQHKTAVSVRKRPNNHTSATQFYVDNPPTGVSSLILAKIKHHYSRIIELRLAPGPAAKVEVKYWMINGYLQNNKSIHGGWPELRSNSPNIDSLQQEGVTNLATYAIDRVTKRKNAPNILHRDVMDLALPTSVESTANRAAQTLEKSLKKAHGGSGNKIITSKRNKLPKWFFHLAVVLEGRNFMYDGSNHQHWNWEVIRG